METVTATLSPPIRVLALVGVLAATGLAVFVFLAGRGASDSGSPALTTPVRKAAQQTPTPAKVHHRPAAVTHHAVAPTSGFPAAVDHALRYRKIVVVAVYMPGAAVDALVRQEAHAAALDAHAGFIPISALNERVVGALVAKTGVLPDPAVVVLRRPGVATMTFSVTDRGTIAQAIAQARR
jgi:hypothetical protein